MFFAGLATVYAVAFGSLQSQVLGLFGKSGIAPIADGLERIRAATGETLWLRVPTLFWLAASDFALRAACWSGIIAAVLLFIGLAPRITALLLWIGYLSFVSIGHPFLSFQWDVLLLEAGLVAVFYAPAGLLPWRRGAARAPPLVRFLLAWLLFRVLFLSGVVKLASDDPVWRDLSALEYHYWTQPLPHRISYFAHHLPAWFHRGSAALMFAMELGAPFLLFAPRRWRHAACLSILLFMGLIAATGNYGFFNLLTGVLCLALIDDRLLGRFVPFLRVPDPLPSARKAVRVSGIVLRSAFALLAVVVTTVRGLDRAGWIETVPRPLAAIDRFAAPWASFNAYGLFADMTTERPEIEIEGSLDGENWRPYRFRYKPGAISRPPVFAGLHMPRLDWQMWFAALRGQPESWFANFLVRLFEGSPHVLALLAEDPFAGERARFLRASLYSYEFSSPAELSQGLWWRRKPLRAFTPTLTLAPDGGLRSASDRPR